MKLWHAVAIALGISLVASSALAYPTTGEAIIKGVTGRPDPSASPADVSVSGVTARTLADVPEDSTVRILCDVDTYAAFGDDTVTAAVGKFMLAASFPEIFNVGPYKRIAFITTGATGTCHVTVMR